MALRVLWTERAVKERNAILDFYRKRNGSVRYSEELLRHLLIGTVIPAQAVVLGRPEPKLPRT